MSAQGVDDILNYLPISANLGTAGQPTAEQFAGIREAGYQVVVNLARLDSTGALPDERDLVIGQGMEYVHIPVVWEHPTSEDLERFFAVVEKHEQEKLFVHCAMNMRVSVFVLLYRVLRLGLGLEAARQDMEEIWTPNEIWQQFIDDALAAQGIKG